MNHCEALRQGYQRLNQIDSVHWCPLGSGAIAGNALGIDRDALASDLGFKNGPSLNAANSTGNRDAVLGTRDTRTTINAAVRNGTSI